MTIETLYPSYTPKTVMLCVVMATIAQIYGNQKYLCISCPPKLKLILHSPNSLFDMA